jgi:hypothetical protein
MLVRMGGQLAGPGHRPQQRTAGRNMMHGINRVANGGEITHLGGPAIHRASRQVAAAVFFNRRSENYADRSPKLFSRGSAGIAPPSSFAAGGRRSVL